MHIQAFDARTVANPGAVARSPVCIRAAKWKNVRRDWARETKGGDGIRSNLISSFPFPSSPPLPTHRSICTIASLRSRSTADATHTPTHPRKQKQPKNRHHVARLHRTRDTAPRLAVRRPARRTRKGIIHNRGQVPRRRIRPERQEDVQRDRRPDAARCPSRRYRRMVGCQQVSLGTGECRGFGGTIGERVG